MTNREKGKRALIDQLPRGTNILMQVNVGKAYDAGYDQGVQDTKEEAYTEGFSDANKYGCRVMIACACLALHEEYGFGEQRMQRFAQAFRAKLLDVLDGNDAIKECSEKFSITMDDEVFEDDEDEL